MAPNPNFDQALVMTLNNLSNKMHDNVSKHNALLNRLNSKGLAESVDGGREIQYDIEYGENGTVMNYSGYEILDLSPQEVFTSVTYPWRQKAVAITTSGLEELINSGKSKRYDQWGKRIDNAMKSMKNVMAADVYSDGTADGGKQIGGLQLLVPDSPTNIVGGIDASKWGFWRNQIYSFTAQGITPSSATIQAAMNNLWLACRRGADTTDLIVCDDTFYTYYWESLQAIQRITSMDGSGTAGAGYTALKFMTADVMADGGLWGSAPAGMYFLNTDHMRFATHKDRKFKPLDSAMSINQDAKSKLITWAGNMVMTNRNLQGRLVA